ncbi:MAG: hypothetical protein JO212_12670 [Acetobacteraceae bacterium]|nr:hypothetical protein [Acetobacteraceae bacterium]MBV8590884.1 hypothetical protein [Acetobacteraceae bacterium]
MNTACRGLVALAMGATMQAGLIGLAIGQTTRVSPAAGAATAYGGTGPEQADVSELAPEPPPSTDLPVLFVTHVEVLRTSADPKLDIVRATGLVSSEGWSAPQLVPTYAGKPGDDILDLELIATPPEQSQNAGGFASIDAIFAIAPGQNFKGVRVRASEDAITVKQIPGSGEATVDVNDCKDCVGKKLVLEGSGQPAASGSIRQDELPRVLRVITPSNGIRGAEQNPNRLSLILDENDTIVEAFWE